jgi:hypothetical protein
LPAAIDAALPHQLTSIPGNATSQSSVRYTPPSAASFSASQPYTSPFAATSSVSVPRQVRFPSDSAKEVFKQLDVKLPHTNTYIAPNASANLASVESPIQKSATPYVSVPRSRSMPRPSKTSCGCLADEPAEDIISQLKFESLPVLKLKKAIIAGNRDKVVYLVENQYDLLDIDTNSAEYLNLAFKSGHPDIYQILKSSGAIGGQAHAAYVIDHLGKLNQIAHLESLTI